MVQSQADYFLSSAVGPQPRTATRAPSQKADGVGARGWGGPAPPRPGQTLSAQPLGAALLPTGNDPAQKFHQLRETSLLPKHSSPGREQRGTLLTSFSLPSLEVTVKAVSGKRLTWSKHACPSVLGILFPWCHVALADTAWGAGGRLRGKGGDTGLTLSG